MHKASVSGCLPLAAPIGLSPLLILTLCGSERVLGGGGHEDPFPNPPPSLSAGPGGGVRRGGCPTCRAGGRGGAAIPKSTAQNDPHVALIILTTRMWGQNSWWKNFSGPKCVIRRLWRQLPLLHKAKGPPWKPISPTPPPPSVGVRSPPPPAPSGANLKVTLRLCTGGPATQNSDKVQCCTLPCAWLLVVPLLKYSANLPPTRNLSVSSSPAPLPLQERTKRSERQPGISTSARGTMLSPTERSRDLCLSMYH